MSLFFGEAAHIGIVVPDMDQAIAGMAAIGVGPVFLMNEIQIPARYRGTRHDLALSAAFAYSGSSLFEFIHQQGDTPSSYQDLLARMPGGGVHHYAYFADDFDAAIDSARRLGASPAIVQEFFDEATGEPYEIYLEMGDLPGAPVVQLMQHGPFDGFYAAMQKAAREWDGSRPVRNALDFIPADIRPPSKAFQ